MRWRKATMMALNILLLHVTMANNKLTVLHDYGNTTPLVIQVTPIKHSSPQQALSSIGDIYRVSTPKMTVGKIEPHKIQSIKGFSQPVFVVGCDRTSKKWLRFYAHRLKQLHAVGYVVNCSGKLAFLKLKGDLDLPLMTVNGAGIYQRFKFSHYPFLITSDYLSQ